jgi:hypothetical protein
MPVDAMMQEAKPLGFFRKRINEKQRKHPFTEHLLLGHKIMDIDFPLNLHLIAEHQMLDRHLHQKLLKVQPKHK